MIGEALPYLPPLTTHHCCLVRGHSAYDHFEAGIEPAVFRLLSICSYQLCHSCILSTKQQCHIKCQKAKAFFYCFLTQYTHTARVNVCSTALPEGPQPLVVLTWSIKEWIPLTQFFLHVKDEHRTGTPR